MNTHQLLETHDITLKIGQSLLLTRMVKRLSLGVPDNSVDTTRRLCLYPHIQNSDGKFVKNPNYKATDLPNTRFGSKLDFDGNTLAISSKGGDLERVTTIDKSPTIFDNGNTEFKVIDNDSGLVSVYETVNDTLLYSLDFGYNKDTQDFGSIMLVKKNHVYLGIPKQQVSTNNILDKGLIAEYRKKSMLHPWTVTRQSYCPWIHSNLKAYISYDKTTNGLASIP